MFPDDVKYIRHCATQLDTRLRREGKRSVIPENLRRVASMIADTTYACGGFDQDFWDELSDLAPRERAILCATYGLIGPPVTFDELAEQYGVTEQRIWQLHRKVVSYLTHPANASRYPRLRELLRDNMDGEGEEPEEDAPSLSDVYITEQPYVFRDFDAEPDDETGEPLEELTVGRDITCLMVTGARATGSCSMFGLKDDLWSLRVKINAERGISIQAEDDGVSIVADEEDTSFLLFSLLQHIVAAARTELKSNDIEWGVWYDDEG